MSYSDQQSDPERAERAISLLQARVPGWPAELTLGDFLVHMSATFDTRSVYELHEMTFNELDPGYDDVGGGGGGDGDRPLYETLFNKSEEREEERRAIREHLQKTYKEGRKV